jgi:hypothetical protein
VGEPVKPFDGIRFSDVRQVGAMFGGDAEAVGENPPRALRAPSLRD